MCVQNNEDEYNGIESTYRCGMCEECCEEHSYEVNKHKAETTTCGNCGMCEECC